MSAGGSEQMAAISEAAMMVQRKSDAVQAYIMHHMVDSHVLQFLGFKIELPGWITLHSVMLVLAAVVLAALGLRASRSRDEAPRGLANVFDLFVMFIRDHIAVPYLGHADGVRMTPLFCTFFSFVLFMNLVGLVPGFVAATSNVSVTGALAMITLGFMVFGAMARQGVVGFFKGFIPHGIPWPILILLVPLELAGLLIKPFALTIRLFANMLAGHTVIASLLGVVCIFGYVALPITLLAVMVYLIEVFVCFLQAYIFTLLSAIFIGERLHPAH